VCASIDSTKEYIFEVVRNSVSSAVWALQDRTEVLEKGLVAAKQENEALRSKVARLSADHQPLRPPTRRRFWPP
jgi:hypothetical protein